MTHLRGDLTAPSDLILVNDEAMTPEEYARWRHDRDRDNKRERERRATDPEYAERVRAYHRAYRAAHLERRREYQRRYRESKGHAECPGDRCQTMTPGGRLCHFCRRRAA